MKNYSLKNLIFIVLLIFSSCKKDISPLFKSNNSEQKEINNIQKENFKNITDTIRVDITDDYKLKIIKENGYQEEIDFFQPIKDKLINEEIYVQILYEKNNIVINLELGENADVYEDIFLSKKDPIIIKQIIRTTINKTNNVPKKIVCEEKINQPFLFSKYKVIDEKLKKCKIKKID